MDKATNGTGTVRAISQLSSATAQEAYELGRQLLLQTARWLPNRQIIGVADSSYAAIELLNAVRSRICMITRLRLNARQFNPPARRRPATVGRPCIIGTRQASLAERLSNPKTRWQRIKVTG